MTAPFDVTQYQRALERWRVLADQRLEHMTLLYDTGRWRRYFTEEKFLKVIRETKEAADRWHRLAAEAEHEARFTLTADEAFGRADPLPAFASPFSEIERTVA
jgi:uncharacterized repeat protein (TIGR03809 family)